MTTSPTPAVIDLKLATESDDRYDEFRSQLANRLAANSAHPLFTTDADPDELWATYLANLPEEHRQHYNCKCCQRFFRDYAGLVRLADHGPLVLSVPAVWSGPAESSPPPAFKKAVDALEERVRKAKVTGLFVSSERVWGVPQTGPWSHYHAVPVETAVHKVKLKTADQVMADWKEKFGVLCRGLDEYALPVVKEALRVIRADALAGAEKARAVAEWFHALHAKLDAGGRHQGQFNKIVWHAVSTVPPEWCHVKNQMFATLMDDIKAGKTFDQLKRSWQQKMHPGQYRRPSAPPTDGQIRAAEKLVETLGLAPSLERRYATLDDVPVKRWVPGRKSAPLPTAQPVPGVFAHLRYREPDPQVQLPEEVMTWTKFQTEVLPTAAKLEAIAIAVGNYYGLLTAVHPDASPLLQWDGLADLPRNPVSPYVYIEGSSATDWGLSSGAWVEVTAVFDAPSHWQKPALFAHHARTAHLALAGAKDSQNPSLCLFPACLKSELNDVRAVIEAHSRKGTPSGQDAGNANGLALTEGKRVFNQRLRVTDDDGHQRVFKIDRWD